MSIREITLFIMVFALGAVSFSLVYEISNITSETPLSIVSNPIDSVTQTYDNIRLGRASERDSPVDHIAENQIKVFSDKVELDVDNVFWSKFTDTNSMDPFLDTGSNGIEIRPTSEDQIQVGDIISYAYKNGIIVHRVIEISEYSDGVYYRTKGDNKPVRVPDKVRFE